MPTATTATALPPQTVAQLQSLEGQLKERDAKVTALLSDKAALDAELKALRDEVAAVKAANAVQPDTHDYSEAETRDYYIDLLLREVGWQLTDKNLEVEVSGMPNNHGCSTAVRVALYRHQPAGTGSGFPSGEGHRVGAGAG
ncbi:MAG: hypothetical protein WCK83_11885 [Burkholderiales bacterium]